MSTGERPHIINNPSFGHWEDDTDRHAIDDPEKRRKGIKNPDYRAKAEGEPVVETDEDAILGRLDEEGVMAEYDRQHEASPEELGMQSRLLSSTEDHTLEPMPQASPDTGSQRVTGPLKFIGGNEGLSKAKIATSSMRDLRKPQRGNKYFKKFPGAKERVEKNFARARRAKARLGALKPKDNLESESRSSNAA